MNRVLELLALMQQGVDRARVHENALRGAINEQTDKRLERAACAAMDKLLEAELWIGEAVRRTTGALTEAENIGDEVLVEFLETTDAKEDEV